MKAALVFADVAEPTAGNVDVSSLHAHVANLHRELTRLGHDVSRHELDTGRIERVGQAAHELHDSWTDTTPDVVHAHLWPSGLAALAALRDLNAADKVPVLLTLHSMDMVDHRRSGTHASALRLKAAVARGVDRVAATSRREAAGLVGKAGVRRGDIDIIPNGVDTELFSPEGTNVRNGRSARLVSAGPLTPSTGFDTVIHALPYLPDVELVIAGGPSAGDGADWQLAGDGEHQRLEELAESLDVVDRVSFIELPHRPDLPHLLRSADVIVCAPWHDRHGSVELEGMACGRPVVASAVGSLTDEVLDGTTGLLVPPRDPRRLASALHRLLSDPIRLDGYGLAAANRARSRHAWPRIAEEVTRSYERLLAA